MYTIDWTAVDGVLHIVVCVYALTNGSRTSMLFPLHFEGTGANARTVGTPYASDLIHKNLQRRSCVNLTVWKSLLHGHPVWEMRPTCLWTDDIYRELSDC